MKKNIYFDKYAKITTKDNKIFNIKKIRIYIGGKIDYYGKQYIISPENNNNDKLQIIDEIYSYDNNRLRFLSEIIKKPVIFDTIEHSNDNSEEKKIKVIQEYEDAYTEISSIPDIIKFESDLINDNKNEKNSKNNKLFKLILKNNKRDI